MDYTTCKYRLYPTDEQQRQFAHIFGCCRFIKNLILEQNEFTHELGFGFTNATKLSREIKELRDDGEIAPWLKEAPAQVLQQAMRDRLEGFSRFFKGQAAYPRTSSARASKGFVSPKTSKSSA
jgi:putative transposase